MFSKTVRAVSGLIAASAVTLALGATPAGAEPATGKPAPDFIGTDTQGKAYRLSEFKGKRVILEWTNHDCPFVGKHYGAGNMQATQKDARAKGAVWLSVISSAPGTQGHVSPAEADELTKTRGAEPNAVLLDPEGKIGRLYGAVTTPHMFIIDTDGKLVYKGAIDSIRSSDTDDIPRAVNYVKQAMTQLVAGQPVSPAGSRPYGCSVKYGS
jgi:peroxiredoxin